MAVNAAELVTSPSRKNQTGVSRMNKTLARHKEAVRRREQAELAMVITVLAAVSSVWLAFATISAVMGA